MPGNAGKGDEGSRGRVFLTASLTGFGLVRGGRRRPSYCYYRGVSPHTWDAEPTSPPTLRWATLFHLLTSSSKGGGSRSNRAGCYGYCGLGCRSSWADADSPFFMKACMHVCRQACLGCHAACLLADSAPNATHKEHTRRGTTGKRLASIAYADPLHRTWFEVAQTSVCCIGRVAAGLAGRSHMCNWTREGNPPSQPAHPRGSDLDGTTNQPPNPPTGKWDRANRTHTRARSQSQKKNACLPRRAGRIDDLVGPAMLRRWTPGVHLRCLGSHQPIAKVYLDSSCLQPCGPASHS